MTNAFNDFSGNRSTYSTAVLWGIAQREGREAKFLTPDEAVSQMTAQPGYRVSAWAAEPMLTQPMAFCWDDRGRLWVAENRDYESRVAGFSNAGNSRILILEDTNRDGVADSRKVFLEGIPFPAAHRRRLRRHLPRRAAQPPVRARPQRRRQGGHVRHRGPAHRVGHPRSSRDDQQPALGAGRLALRSPGLRDLVEDQEAAREGASLQGEGAVSGGHPRGRWRRHQRRRLALSPDQGRLRSGRARVQQPVGDRLRRQGTAPHQRLRHPAPLARDPRRHLSPAGRPALQPVRLRRHQDDRRPSPSLRARRRAGLPVRRVSGLAARPHLHGQHPRARGAVRRAGAEGVGLHGAPRRRLHDGQQRPLDRVQPRDRSRRRALRPRLARRRHLRPGRAAPGDRPHLPHRAAVGRAGVGGPLCGSPHAGRRRPGAAPDQRQRLARPTGPRDSAGPRR